MTTWRDRAECLGYDLDTLMYPDQVNPHPYLREATSRWCAKCPVVRECRIAGLAEEYGVWGGLTPSTRKRLRTRLGFTITPRQARLLLDRADESGDLEGELLAFGMFPEQIEDIFSTGGGRGSSSVAA